MYAYLITYVYITMVLNNFYVNVCMCVCFNCVFVQRTGSKFCVSYYVLLWNNWFVYMRKENFLDAILPIIARSTTINQTISFSTAFGAENFTRYFKWLLLLQQSSRDYTKTERRTSSCWRLADVSHLIPTCF